MYITQEIVNMNLQENIRRILKEESLKKTLIDEIKTDGWFNVSQYVGIFGIVEDMISWGGDIDYEI